MCNSSFNSKSGVHQLPVVEGRLLSLLQSERKNCNSKYQAETEYLVWKLSIVKL